jgi:nitrogen regulatory protein PII
MANEKKVENFTPYEKNHRLERLLFLTIIVNEGQESAIVSLVQEAEAAVSFTLRGKGTATSDFYEVMGLGESNKHVILTVIKEANWATLKTKLLLRFAVSKWSKGVAYATTLDSLCGISTYKILTNTRLSNSEAKGASVMEEKNLAEKKDEYEIIAAIVNDGFTDLVMNAAKGAGAHGGTILTARGTGNKDIEKFFGVVITPEKQIVLILVPRKIRDVVMEAIGKEAGINTRGQGICFSFPASDVVGVYEEASESEPKAALSESEGGSK